VNNADQHPQNGFMTAAQRCSRLTVRAATGGSQPKADARHCFFSFSQNTGHSGMSDPPYITDPKLVPDMNVPGNVVPVYIDQNILSHLREGKDAREELVGLLRTLEEKNAVFVYSMTHVDECRDSSQPEMFVEVMEELPVYLIEFQNASDQQAALSLGRARELLLEPEDATHHAKRLIEDLLHVYHFASGWLGETEAQELKNEMAAEIAGFWETLQRDVDWDVLGAELGGQAKHALSAAQYEMGALIEGMSFEQIRDEWEKGWMKLKERLLANYAQLDDIPDEEAVSFVFSCLEEQDREAVQRRFPQGFWNRLEGRETGELAGLAFMLFMCGLVRDRRVKKGSTVSRMQHFRGQFRDGVHIENAARCAVFITCDKGAARLARSLYAYTGIETKVVELEIRDATAR
jgi:hypothetical protein